MKPSLLEVAETFLNAQKIDITVTTIADGVEWIIAHDDHPLVNTYVIVEDASSTGPHAVASFLRSARLDAARTDLIIDAARTDLIIPDESVIESKRWTDATRGEVRRVVGQSAFLDGHLRSKRICDKLLEERHDAADSESALLSEKDFVDQWAQIDGAESVHAMDYLFNHWAKGKTPRVCVAIAAAGHGKSKVTHILAKRIARKYMYAHKEPEQNLPPVPILITFGQHQRFTSFTGIILEALGRYGNPLLTIEAFRYLVSLRRVLFILDGYDEMMEASSKRARENFLEFIHHAGADSRILLTARSVYYRTATDVVGQVGDPFLSESEVEILDIQPFDKDQAKWYLKRRLEHEGHRSRTLERAQAVLDNEDSLAILRSPLFLAEFATSIAPERWSITTVRQEGSLEFLIKRTFERECGRQHHEFSNEQQQAFLEGIAFDMLATGTSGYAREELEVFVAEAVDNDLLLQDWPKLASHYFLSPDREGPHALVTIRHQVWRDYFQGTALANKLSSHNEDTRKHAREELVGAKDLPEGVLRSTARALPPEMWERLISESPWSSNKTVRNLLRMHFFRCGNVDKITLPPELAVSLSDQDLSGLSISNTTFSAASLVNSNLTDTYFDKCDLSESNLSGAILSRTNFRSCRLPSDIVDAEISSVMIDEDLLFGPQVLARFSGPGLSPRSGAEDFQTWVATVLQARLNKFVKRTVGEKNEVIDNSMSWIAFMGGTDPKEREFVARKLYRALQAEGIVTTGTLSGSGHPLIQLSADPRIQQEIKRFVLDDVQGSAIQAVVQRLTR